MFPLKLLAATGATLLATTALATATSYSYSETKSYGPQTTNWGTSTNTTAFTPQLTIGFTGFNTSLGTLLDVVVTITESLSGSINLTNSGSGSSRVAGNVQNTLKVKLPGAVTKTVVDQSNSVIENSLGAGASTGYQSVSGSADQTATYFLPPSLTPFKSAWSAVFGDLGQVAVSSDNGNGHAEYTDMGKMTIQVTYYYTGSTPPPSIPEPASLALFGAGLAGLGVVRRRRKP